MQAYLINIENYKPNADESEVQRYGWHTPRIELEQIAITEY